MKITQEIVPGDVVYWPSTKILCMVISINKDLLNKDFYVIKFMVLEEDREYREYRKTKVYTLGPTKDTNFNEFAD